MEESQKMFDPMPVEREETLVTASDASLSTPRFDEVEAQVARPVVPLANNPLRRAAGGVRRRQWPIALVLISALAGGVVSLLAFRLYQQRQQQSQVAATQTDAQTPETDAATEPTPLAETDSTQTEQPQQQAQTESPVVFEEFDPAKEGVATNGGGGGEVANATRKTTEAEAKPASSSASAGKEERKEERKEDAKPAPRAAEPRPRLVETIPATRPVGARGENVSRDERGDDEDFFEERRERRRERRERRRGRGRNIDRIKDIFEGPPPA
jgi:hypothetical protein